MLETIYSVVSFVETILLIYGCYFTTRYVGTTPIEDKKKFIKLVNKAVNIQIVIGLLFTITFVLSVILSKAGWVRLMNFACAMIWLNYAKKNLKISNKIQDDEDK